MTKSLAVLAALAASYSAQAMIPTPCGPEHKGQTTIEGVGYETRTQLYCSDVRTGGPYDRFWSVSLDRIGDDTSRPKQVIGKAPEKRPLELKVGVVLSDKGPLCGHFNLQATLQEIMKDPSKGTYGCGITYDGYLGGMRDAMRRALASTPAPR